MDAFFLAPSTGLLGLAVSGFLSATLLPGSSEALLLLVVKQGATDPLLSVAVVSVANTLGGFSTYWLGWWSQGQLVAKGKYTPPSSRAIEGVRRWGAPALLLSWLPIVGDGLCLAAGWLGVGWLPSLVAMLLGKTVRYCAIVYLLQSL